MAARLIVSCVCVAGLFPLTAWASDAVEAAARVHSTETAVPETACPGTSAGVVLDSIKPRIGVEMPDNNREQIDVSFRIALERVREVPECGGMFTELGADGVDTLGRAIFYPIGRHALGTDVCRGRVASTIVGGGPIWLCRGFSALSDNRAAMIIIHEALHHAGLTEWPRDRKGMTSAAINDMVMTRCGL